MELTEFVSSLRQLADWYETHPTLPIPYDFKNPMLVFLHDADEAKSVLRAIGSFEKHYEDEHFEAIKDIGAIKLRFYTNRDNVCVAKVVGKRQVERQVIPSSYTPEQVIEAHEEDVIVWDCEPILKDAPEVEVAK